MRLESGSEGSDPLRSTPIGRLDPTHEERLRRRAGVVAVGTLACPRCDAPVVPSGRLRVTDAVACPYCDHVGRVRDFLSLAVPTRPARVVLRLVPRPAQAAKRGSTSRA